MKKLLRFILPTTGLLAVLALYVSATASVFTPPEIIVKPTFSEPVMMLLVGFGLIAFGSLIKKYSIRG